MFVCFSKMWEYGPYLIYKHTSPSGKSYIGYTKNLKRRNREHSSASGLSPAFHNAISFYGWENIQTEILEERLILEEAKELEKFYIKFFNTRMEGYNCTDGGDGNAAKCGKDNINATSVRCLNILTLNEILFDTLNDAANYCKINPSIISIIIKNVEKNKNNGCIVASKTFTFQKYDPSFPNKPFDLTLIKTKEEKKQLNFEKHLKYSKAVIGTHTLGFTVEYQSTHEAERDLKIQHGYVSRNARGLLGPCGGFNWLFKDKEERDKYTVWKKSSRSGSPGIVIQRIKDDTIDIFHSIIDAVRKTKISRKIINKCIQKNIKDVNGFFWCKL